MNLISKSSFIILAVALFSLSAFAEKKTFTVKGMHCDACADSIRAKLCKDEVYKTCTVKIKNEKKELGEVTLESKEGSIDMKAVKAIIEAEGFKL